MPATTTTATKMTPFLAALEEAAYLNTEGVAALSHPDPRGVAVAMTAFRQSLRILQELSPHPGGPQPPSPLEHPRITSSAPARMPSDGSFYVYDQPKLFLPTCDEALAREQLPVFSVLVVFNTALTYHRRGLETNCAKYYDAAFKLYENCAQLCLVHGGNNEEILVLYLGVANNVALIQNELVHLEALQDTVTTLRSVLDYLSERDQNMSPSHTEVINEFQLNLMTVNAKSPASAA